MPFNYCHSCGSKLPDDAKYCPECGILLGSEGEEYADEEPVLLSTLLPRLLDAFENIAVRDFFRMMSAVKLIALRPQKYNEDRLKERYPHLFTMLLMATFAGTFKLYNDPVYGVWMAKLDFGNDVVQTIVSITVYLSLSTFFGAFAVIMARLVHSVLRLSIERDLFVRAMMTVFILFAFIIDILSPFWNIPVEKGLIIWGYYDIIKTFFTLLYGYLVYRGLLQSAEMKLQTAS